MILDSLFPAVERRAVVERLGHPRAGAWVGIEGADTLAGVTVTPETALTFSACWAATNKIASSLARLPCKVKQKQDNDGRREATELQLYEVLLNEPNPEMDAFTFWEIVFSRWVNWGNFFAEIVRRGSDVIELWPIHPSRVAPFRPEAGSAAGNLQYVVSSDSAGSTTFDRGDILNIVGHLSEDGLIGRGVFQMARESIGTALANQNYQGSYYGNGARPTGVLMHKDSLEPEARKNLRDEWNAVHQGGGRFGKIAVLWEDMKYEPISHNAEESQLVQHIERMDIVMAQWYDLPPHTIRNLTRSSFSNIDSEQRSLVIDSFEPRVCRVEKSLRRQLLSERQRRREQFFIKFNMDALLRGDPEKRANVNRTKLMHGALTLDQWLRSEDMPIIGGELGETRFFPQNMTTLGQIVAGANVSTPAQGQPGAPAGEDAPPPGENEDNRSVVLACRESVVADLRHMLGVEINAVMRAAKRPAEFMARVEEFYESHRLKLLGCLAHSVNAWLAAQGHCTDAAQRADALARQWCERSKQELFEAADGDRRLFESRVTAVCNSWHARAITFDDGERGEYQ